jgi:hypothetical protein
MKKFAVTAAVPSCFVSFGMGKTTFDKFNDYVCEWSEELTALVSADRIKRKHSEFSTDLFKEKLREEIGNDTLAQEAFKLFHGRDFVGLWKHWKTK